MTIADNLNRIKSATDEIKSIADACLDTETDKVDVYPNRIAKAIVDTPTEQTFNGTRTLEGIKDGIAYVDKVKGKSMVWNQLVNTSVSTITKNGITLTHNDNGSLTFSGTWTARTQFTLNMMSVVQGRVYIMSILGYSKATLHDSAWAISDYGVGYYVKNKKITLNTAKKSQDRDAIFIDFIGLTEGDVINETIYPQIFDLTQMFGSGNEPSTPDEFAQRLGYATIDDLPYFDYDEGSLLSFNATSIQSKDADANVIDTHSFNISQIKDSNGDTLFPYGLLSAGDVYDEINGDKAIKRVGVVDLGTLSYWMSNKNTYQSFGVTFPHKSNINAISTLQIVNGSGVSTGNSIGIQVYTPNRLYVSDGVSETTNDIKTAMQGVLLYYELDTPIEVNLSPYKQYYKVQNGGTETLVASGNTTPLIADIGYRSAMSAEELVTTLNDTLNN